MTFENFDKIAEQIFMSESDKENARIAIKAMLEKGVVEREEFMGQLCKAFPDLLDVACRALRTNREGLIFSLDKRLLNSMPFLYLIDQEYGKTFDLIED